MKFDDLLKARNSMKKRKFVRQNNWKKKRITRCDNWRRPTGIDSKMRLGLNGKSNVVSPGFGSPRAVRGLRRDGLKEVIVANVDDLKKVVSGCIGVVGAGVGARKKIQIIRIASEHKVALANCSADFIKEFEAVMKARKALKDNKKSEKKSSDKKEKLVKSEDELKKEREKDLIKKGAL